jgi:anti-anti-sigma factor
MPPAMNEAINPSLFAEIANLPARPDVLRAKLVGPSLAQRETPIVSGMLTEAVNQHSRTLKYLVLDMSAITFMNSSALGALVALHKHTAAHTPGKAKVVLVGLNAELLKLIQMVRFDKLLGIARDAAELQKLIGK